MTRIRTNMYSKTGVYAPLISLLNEMSMLSLCMFMSMVLTCKEEREKLFLFVKDDKQFFFIIIGNEQYRNLVTIINLMLWQNKVERLYLMKYFWLCLIFPCKIFKNIKVMNNIAILSPL